MLGYSQELSDIIALRGGLQLPHHSDAWVNKLVTESKAAIEFNGEELSIYTLAQMVTSYIRLFIIATRQWLLPTYHQERSMINVPLSGSALGLFIMPHAL